MKSRDWIAAGGAWFAILTAFLATGAACVVRILASPSFSVAAATGVIVSLAMLVFAFRVPRFGVGVSMGIAFSLVPSLFLGCAWALALPLATTHMRCGTGDVGLPLVAAFAMAVGGLIALPLAALTNIVGRLVHRAFVVLGVAAVLVTSIVVVRGFGTWSRPEPDDFERLFDERVPIEAGQKLTLGATTFDYVRSQDVKHEQTPEDGYGLGEDGRVVRLLPMGQMCVLQTSSQGVSRSVSLSAESERCPGLDLLHDRRADDALVVPRGAHDDVTPYAIIGERVEGDLSIVDLGDRLGAPHAWLVGSALGLLFAALAMARAVAMLRRERKARSDLDATHTGGGWVAAFDARYYVDELATAEPGPVVVKLEDARQPHTYRNDATPRAQFVSLGTCATRREDLREAVVGWVLTALATIAVTSAPLWAARIHGLL